MYNYIKKTEVIMPFYNTVLFDADGTPKALFAAVADGPGGFQKAENTWNQVFPL